MPPSDPDTFLTALHETALPPSFLMVNPGKASPLEMLLRTMYLLRIHQKITFKSECKVGHPNIMTSVPLPHPSIPYSLMPNPGEVASLGLLLRTIYLSKIHQKTLYGSECKVCGHGCPTICPLRNHNKSLWYYNTLYLSFFNSFRKNYPIIDEHVDIIFVTQ